jgi:cytochrome c oxidase subunit 3
MARAQLAEHYEDLDKQEHAARFGMWVFLSSELLLFAALFGLYASYRAVYPADFGRAAAHNHVLLGTLNTVVLISSSFCVAWALHSVRAGNNRTALCMLAVTLGCGAAFLVIKGIEYGLHIEEGILPAGYYRMHAFDTPGARMFFTLYYLMTGLHALHVIAGMSLLTWAGIALLRDRVDPTRPTLLENAGLYWHLVDVIWIYLWPLLYLLR